MTTTLEHLRRHMNRLYETEGLSKAFRIAHAKYVSRLGQRAARLFGYQTVKKPAVKGSK